MNTTFTFLHPVSGVNSETVSRVLTAVGIKWSIKAIRCEDNMLIITADRHLSEEEKDIVAGVFRSAFPLIEDAAK